MDVCNADSMQEIHEAYGEVKRYAAEGVPMVVCACKCDMHAERVITHEVLRVRKKPTQNNTSVNMGTAATPLLRLLTKK